MDANAEVNICFTFAATQSEQHIEFPNNIAFAQCKWTLTMVYMYLVCIFVFMDASVDG